MTVTNWHAISILKILVQIALQLLRIDLVVGLDEEAARGIHRCGRLRQIVHVDFRWQVFVDLHFFLVAIFCALSQLIAFMRLVVRRLVTLVGQSLSNERLAVDFLGLRCHLTPVQALKPAQIEEFHGEFDVGDRQPRLPIPT